MNLKVAVVATVALGSLIYCGYKHIKAKKALDELINRYKKDGMPEEETPEVVEPQEESKEEQQEAVEATAEEPTNNEPTTDEKTEEQSK